MIDVETYPTICDRTDRTSRKSKPQSDRLLERTDAMFTSIARFFHALRRYEAAMWELSHLSDRELADIGTDRAEISRLAWEHAHSSLR